MKKRKVFLMLLTAILLFSSCEVYRTPEPEPPTDAEAVATAYDDLTWDIIKGRPGFQNSAESDVHFDLTLPVAASNGVSVSWTSTDTARVDTDGTVVMNPNGSGTAAVTIEATLTKGIESDTKQFLLTVREEPLLTDYQAVADQVLALVNTERTGAALTPLTMNVLLTNAAVRHSTDMALHGFLNHEGSDGSVFSLRITEAGYVWTGCAENIAVNYTNASDVMAAWMASQGHRDNIMNPEIQEMGISCIQSSNGWYWTQTFGKP